MNITITTELKRALEELGTNLDDKGKAVLHAALAAELFEHIVQDLVDRKILTRIEYDFNPALAVYGNQLIKGKEETYRLVVEWFELQRNINWGIFAKYCTPDFLEDIISAMNIKVIIEKTENLLRGKKSKPPWTTDD